MQPIKDRLLSARNEKGLSQAELAAAVGVSQVAIQHLESGRNRSSTRLTQIARALGVNPDWLDSGNGPRYPAPDDYGTPADRLRMARLLTTLSPADFGRRCGAPEAVVITWESGGIEPDLDMYAVIGEISGLNSQWLQTGEGNPQAGTRLEVREAPGRYEVAPAMLAVQRLHDSGKLTDRSMEIFRRLLTAASERRLSEDDLVLLDNIAKRFEGPNGDAKTQDRAG